MKLYTFSLFLILSLAFSIGCESQNPICGDTLCVDGSVFLKSELPAGAEYDSVNVDESIILATLVGTPVPIEVETIPVASDDVTLADIVADVESGSTKYLNQTVTITAVVESDNSVFNSGAITLITNTPTSFFITDRENPNRMNAYKSGRSYTFTVFIRKIEPPDESFDNYAVFSNLEVGTENLEPSIPVNNPTLAEVIQDAAAGNSTFVGQTLQLSGTVVWREKNGKAVVMYTDNSFEDAAAEGAVFFILSIQSPEKLIAYTLGKTHTFTVIITSVDPPDETLNLYKIRSYFAD